MRHLKPLNHSYRELLSRQTGPGTSQFGRDAFNSSSTATPALSNLKALPDPAL